jgi:glycerate kinase
VLALASPASLKGVLHATEAATLLAAGMRRVDGVDAVELPVADGGEGTLDVLHRALGGEWMTAAVTDPLGRPVAARWLLLPDGTAVVESAQAVGLPLLRDDELDPLNATTRGLGELLLATLTASPRALLVGVGGTATVDGAAFAALGAELCDGAELVLDTIAFDEHARAADLVVTGEGTVDATTLDGKAPGAVVRRCARLGIRCELFGGAVRDGVPAHALSGRRALAGEDVVQLGEELARLLLQ